MQRKSIHCIILKNSQSSPCMHEFYQGDVGRPPAAVAAAQVC